MKIKDILKKIEDTGLYIEIIDTESGASYGFFRKNDSLLVYNNKLKNKNIQKLNVQYINNKRILILYIND